MTSPAPQGEYHTEEVRLQKYLVQSGAAPSRRTAEELIRAGRVMVDNEIATLGRRIRPGDVVHLDGHRLSAIEQRLVLAFNKPPGVTTTRKDPHAERTVYEFLPQVPGLHPVGRLDRDSEGLLLFTNDGTLTERITHPRYGIHKVYRLWCREGTLGPQIIHLLSRGVDLEEGLARPVSVGAKPGGALMVLAEGKKREIRRMLEAVGYHVERLLRVAVGPVQLGNLDRGAWRELSPPELEQLGALVLRPAKGTGIARQPGRDHNRGASMPAKKRFSARKDGKDGA